MSSDEIQITRVLMGEKQRKQLLLHNSLLAKARKRKLQQQQQQAQGEQQGEQMIKTGTRNLQVGGPSTSSSGSTSKCVTNANVMDSTDEIVVISEIRNGIMNKQNNNSNGKNPVDNDEEEMRQQLLRKMATQALVREAQRSSERAQTFGPQGWLKPRSLATNKAFLARTLKSVELDRREREEKTVAAISSHRRREHAQQRHQRSADDDGRRERRSDRKVPADDTNNGKHRPHHHDRHERR